MSLCLLICSCQANKTEQKKEATTQYMTEKETEETTEKETEPAIVYDNTMQKIDMSKWLYNETDKVYYQIGLKYCENPVDESYESFAIFVPKEYMNGKKNEDDTYTCSISETGINNRYTGYNCPIVMPIETPGYSACKALTEYSEKAKTYTKEGFVYVYAGARGREHGAPLGVVDYKACIKYLKYNQGLIPGNTNRIVAFGMSGGGAQSAVLGVSGNNALFDPYLEKIGAVKGYKDDVYACMCWCPITNLDSADMAYEWMMGKTRKDKAASINAEISQTLSDYYVDYINSLELKDENSKILKLDTNNSHSGSYYDYVVSIIENSLNEFFVDHQFPYTVAEKQMVPINKNDNKKQDKKSTKQKATETPIVQPETIYPTFANPDGGSFRPFAIGGIIMGFTNTDDLEEENTVLEPMAIDESDDETEPESEESTVANKKQSSKIQSTASSKTPETIVEGKNAKVVEKAIDDKQEEKAATEIDNITRNVVTGGVTIKGTYNTKEDYIKALNANGEWILFDNATQKYKITSIEDFAMAVKRANKNIGAFDQLDKGQGENVLFGFNGSKSHFDKYLKEIVSEGKDTKVKTAFEKDFEIVDEFGNDVETRLNMMSPAYYLNKDSKGYKSSTVAPYFRIRTGCWQSDTSLTTEINLDLMLKEYGVSSDFATIWGEGHEKAERVSTADKNFISWVNFVSRKVAQ